MLAHLATATPGAAGYALIVLVLLVVTVGYAVTCWIFPFRSCRRCHGDGKRRSAFGKGRTFGLCRRCDGTGRALRPGRRVLNYLRDLNRAAR